MVYWRWWTARTHLLSTRYWFSENFAHEHFINPKSQMLGSKFGSNSCPLSDSFNDFIGVRGKKKGGRWFLKSNDPDDIAELTQGNRHLL